MDISQNNVLIKKDQCKHLVLSGGGVAGFSYYGALKESAYRNVWNIENIQSIYGTSIGAFIAVMLSLKFDWNTLDNFLIKRPWHNLFKLDMYSFIDAIQKRGIFSIETFEKIFAPLFLAKDLRTNVTLIELFQFTHIDIHIFTIDVNTFQVVDLSHKTHPDWRVIDAIYCSCALPILFSPLFKENVFFYDAAVLFNYPLPAAILNGCKPEEILGIRPSQKLTDNVNLKEDSTLVDYMLILLAKQLDYIDLYRPNRTIEHTPFTEYSIPPVKLSLVDIFNTLSNMDERIRLIRIGEQIVADLENP